ncbi:MAG: substrate-binding domain-containing protein [Bacteroidia bacterium]|nr:substrate-binding domain-containing protein [Bacteroidia bacterium]MDW8302062.1 substrate-binding domain-containing protein [Bacteroidia bacterium]
MSKIIVCLGLSFYTCFALAQFDTLRVSGSKYLCEIIQNMLSDFYALNPNCIVKFVSTENTPRAISDFILQGAEVALTIHPISEIDKKRITFTYKEQEFARDAIVLYTHHKNPVKGLTLSQIHELFVEKIHDWSSINGKNEKITLIAYPLGHDFTTYLYKNVWKREYYSINAVVAESHEQMQAKLNLNHSTVGYTAHSLKLKGHLVPILVDGTPILPNEENVLSGKYPLSYSCYAIVNTQKPFATKFLEWLMLPATKKKLKTHHLYCFLI